MMMQQSITVSAKRESIFRNGRRSFCRRLSARDFLHDSGGALLADLAGGVVDAALRQSEFASAIARFRVELVKEQRPSARVKAW